mmetsp:Transcript_8603/g.12498  ORF Transcript_8603/g.12498 Transcript_8603/m.12498 type:complete len:175 (-) Transcript_8603:528-1052(-)
MSSSLNTADMLEWALRVCQSVAFFLHGILGMTEPWTGCLRHAFRDTHGGMPVWSWPVAGILLWTVAIANFSSNGKVILAAQAYIAAFHMGGVFYHIRLQHHPVAGCAPAVFAVLATIIVAIRLRSFVVALVGWLLCTMIAYFLSLLLVTPPPDREEEKNLLEEQGHSAQDIPRE